ncbi:MAG: hypothetical protein AAFN10_26645, partial [Bacteroidota bacterium]
QSIKIQTSTVVIPNEPYTPILKDISLDYTASADSQNADIDFYQLLPFTDSFQAQPLDANPDLLYNIKDEGTLFIGLQNLTPGSILNLYFQLAEATADSEFDPAVIEWAYIKDNQWQTLRDQFQILADGTEGFTRSGIVKISVPGDISTENVTLLAPTEEPLYWFKVSAKENTAAICETIAVYTQAVKVKASLQADNDLNRLAQPLPKESLADLAQADSAISTVLQPADSQGGSPPESDDTDNYYLRVSERLRHKGRAVNAFDYERIVLEAFPMIRTVKCITHAMSLAGSTYRQDLQLAPGFVTIALIPDLEYLKSANSATPKASISLLNEIKTYLQARVSPFVQLKIANPRYEAVHVEVDVQFKPGLNASFYLKELAREIRLFLTPWLGGDQAKLCFAHGASQSDLVGFVEARPYVDFISCVNLFHDENYPLIKAANTLLQTAKAAEDTAEDDNDAKGAIQTTINTVQQALTATVKILQNGSPQDVVEEDIANWEDDINKAIKAITDADALFSDKAGLDPAITKMITKAHDFVTVGDFFKQAYLADFAGNCASSYVDIEGQVSPRTPRSILLAGDITTRQFAKFYCEQYQPNSSNQIQ